MVFRMGQGLAQKLETDKQLWSRSLSGDAGDLLPRYQISIYIYIYIYVYIYVYICIVSIGICRYLCDIYGYVYIYIL